MHSGAATVKDYISELPAERKRAISIVRKEILKNLPAGFEEAMNWGMITYQVPLQKHPDTYNKQPLMYAALASQKNHMAVYLSSIYVSEHTRKQFEREYKATGKKLNAGKSCVRFNKLEDLPLDLIGKTIGEIGVDDFIDVYESARVAHLQDTK